MAENQRHTRLQKLSDSDFEIVDGQPDIRGWYVKDGSGKQIGEVDELIFDYQSRKVRYLVVDLEENDLDLDDKEVLVPIGIAELDNDDDDVVLPGVTAEQLRSLPEYDEDRFDTEHETNVRNVFGGLGGAAAATATAGVAGTANTHHDDDFYQHEQFNDARLYKNRNRDVATNDDATIEVVNEELLVGKREVETGGVHLRSRVVEQEVSEDINLREEHVVVERNPVDREATAADLHEEGIEVREHAEVPVVNKEARVVEEIHLSKDVDERTETIHGSVRNTEVDIDQLDSNNTARRDDNSGNMGTTSSGNMRDGNTGTL